ncbi:MAG: hypothetical protein IJV91_09215 [Kiritimatiellae bacterium]|nr:hypothetical protein [Kiritimatiellia bacterium]
MTLAPRGTEVVVPPFDAATWKSDTYKNRMKIELENKDGRSYCNYVLKRMARFLNRKSQRRYRLKFADSYYGEMAHYGLYRLATVKTRI